MRRISSALMPVGPATASGVNGSASARTSSTPVRCSPGVARSSAKSVWTIAKSSSGSDPGRMKWCSSACSAVRERRGSTTTTFPPRSRIPRMRPRASGEVISDPLEASGLAPSTSRCMVRSRSGTGMESAPPNMYPHETCLGIWSTVDALKTFLVPSALLKTRP